ncbi:MAG: putative membrane protein [Salibacteraceae bacterium]|jgi:putative membrane protein
MYTKNTRSFSALFNAFGPQLAWYGPYVTAIYVGYQYLGFKDLDIKMSIATVLGFAVALLLGFRTSASYDRWWEGRKIWGGVVNDSRTLIRQLIGFVGEDEVSVEIKKMANYQIAWTLSLKNSLRSLEGTQEYARFLSAEEVVSISTKNNKPNEILKFMTQLLSQLKRYEKIDSFQMVALDQTLKNLGDHMGKAERIKYTVFPTQYRFYTHIGLIIYSVMLPFGMLYSTGPFVIVICLLVSFFFNMLENIAFFLQDPFMNRASDIPMTAICRTIEINLKELVEETNIPHVITPDENGVLM